MVEKEKINLYVDDLRDCPEGFILARNVEEAKYYLDEYNVNILSLDHDLGMAEDGTLFETGYDLVKYICENAISIDKIYLHTDNPVGREYMYSTLLASKRSGIIPETTEVFPYPVVPNRYTGRDWE